MQSDFKLMWVVKKKANYEEPKRDFVILSNWG